MHLDTSTVTSAKGTSYRRVLLRTSFRENGRVRHRTLGNLSGCSEQEVNAVRLALKHKDQLAGLLAAAAVGSQAPAPGPSGAGEPEGPFTQGPSVGAVAVLRGIAEQMGIVAALGNDKQGRLALWQVIARALDQGSRLSAVRLARDLGAPCILGLPDFDEDSLYANLAWLHKRQHGIEESLFAQRYAKGRPTLYLYDVTSTYLEGGHNALAAFGYNRDGRRGKKQIVIGLLCDEHGVPVAIEGFTGNTSDPKTVGSQITKLQERFGACNITLVGDRGMLRGPQIEALNAVGLHYITAISKPQIETLLDSGTLQMELFDQELGEVIVPATVAQPAPEGAPEGALEGDGAPPRMERYIMRRNPVRREEMAATRASKLKAIEASVAEASVYLKERARARPGTAQRRIEKRVKSLGLSNWLSVTIHGREISLCEDAAALEEDSRLDGCYVLRTDLEQAQASKQSVHARYKSLAEVEQAFRRSKTVELDLRPVHVRKEESTRGHLVVVMLAYQLMKELGRRWAHLDMTVREGLDRLNTYCAIEVAGVIKVMLQPRADVQALIDAAKVTLPTHLPGSTVRVATRKKLPKNRPTRKK